MHERKFEDGAAYERMMGAWSRLVGPVFLDWVAPVHGMRWIDIGCGNGAFTEQIIERCAPSEAHGVDLSNAQLEFARARCTNQRAEFHLGDAMALPFNDQRFDAAVMALVIFFVSDPQKGVAEMVRVVRRGGLVCAYAWDMGSGSHPAEPILAGMRELGHGRQTLQSDWASGADALRTLWHQVGLEAVETYRIVVERSFSSFDEFWSTSLKSNVGRAIAAMPPEKRVELRKLVYDRMAPDAVGRVTGHAAVNAVKGRVRQASLRAGSGLGCIG